MKGIVTLLPLILALVGASGGVCGAMLYRQDPGEWARVHLGDSLPLALAGLVGGAAAGGVVGRACARWPRVVPAVGVGAAALLGAALAAPLGWIAGDLGTERLARQGMAAGAGVGAVVGLVFGLGQLRLDRRPSPTGPLEPDQATDYRDGPGGSVPPGAAEPDVAPRRRPASS